MDKKLNTNQLVGAVLTFLILTTAEQVSANDVELDFPHNYNAWETTSEEGCYHSGKFFKVGELEAMNKADLDEYKNATGYRASDGYAVMMLCTYDVHPGAGDHPKPEDRNYKWVAYSWYW